MDGHSQDLRNLISRLDAELMERYPKQEVFGVEFSDSSVQDVRSSCNLMDYKGVQTLDGSGDETSDFANA